MAWSTGSVKDDVQNELGSGIPSTLTGSVIEQMAQRAVRRVGNYVGHTLDPESFDDKYEPAVFNWTMMSAHAKISQEGGGRGYSLGDFKVSPAKDDVHEQRAMSHDKNAREELRMIGARANYGRTY